ncbi:LIM/homeobox protein Lhx9-like [Dreissena polymorpha]|uniref:Uncharacterized protein n=1 Tax=Dreissena polymorpha TaxID=45954 RepID=A0A9D4F8C0_DREPO|nr:LIM/homeobox protein Lhx9-like [Dreissena polymorpha]KAH3794155.1 hypothetical protein DPMN_147686 [Dreissena polymorpha]
MFGTLVDSCADEPKEPGRVFSELPTDVGETIPPQIDSFQIISEPGSRCQDGVCAGCGARILDRFFLSVAGQHWHVTCLRCAECNTQLDTQITCFVRDGLVFCKRDYQRRFSLRRCFRCHIGISSTELVMRSRDRYYHVECFTCVTCHRPLIPGDTYGVHDDQVFCQEDYDHVLNNFQSGSPYYSVYDCNFTDYDAINDVTDDALEYYSSGYEFLALSRSRKRRHMIVPEGCFQTLGLLTNKHGDFIPRDKYCGTPPRQKRVRTSFKHTQLRTMKSYFAVNHNPDAKDLKELAKKTQLSKRVLQVWFQNARAKFRRSSSKQTNDPTEQDPSNTEQVNTDTDQLLDLSKCRSPALSDVSTCQSMTSLDLIESTSKLSDSVNESFSDDNVSS